ncbi:MAG: lactate utilization protein [Planctomycetaceae bacterium]|nr:lactate utilization protein [Planctomycetaceae bacterium]
MTDLWPAHSGTADSLLNTFETSLTAAAGEMIRCVTTEDAVNKSRQLMQQLCGKRVGIVQRTWIQEVSEKWTDIEKIVPPAPEHPEEVSLREMAEIDIGVVHAEYLLADTGSCVIASPTAFDRLLCYLSPVCFVFAKKETLRPHLPAAWPEISARMVHPNDPVGAMNQSGEFLIVTGPSRTADIEKILILGVHGPKRLIVFVVE